jgi:mannose-6-phosphate isomerase-like protein (cupin superfamily)
VPSEPSLEQVFAAPLADRVIGPRDGSFVVAEWSDPGSDADTSPRLIAPLHVHHEDDEAWYVLEGTLRFRLGERELEAPAGSAVFGPRGVPHTFWNPGPQPCRYLLVMTPRTLQLIEELHALPDREPETLRRHFRQYGCEIME